MRVRRFAANFCGRGNFWNHIEERIQFGLRLRLDCVAQNFAAHDSARHKFVGVELSAQHIERIDAAPRPANKNTGVNEYHQVSPRLGLAILRSFIKSYLGSIAFL